MSVIKTELERKLFDALKRISKYASPSNLRRNAERAYGISADEAIEMSYENVIFEAKQTIKGVRLPKVKRHD